MRVIPASDASKLSSLGYSLRSGANGQQVLKELSFEDDFAREIARAMVEANSNVSPDAKKVAARLARSMGFADLLGAT